MGAIWVQVSHVIGSDIGIGANLWFNVRWDGYFKNFLEFFVHEV